MAEFCLKCFNKVNDTNYSKFDVIEEWGICEECGEHTVVVVDLRGFGLFNFFYWLASKLSFEWMRFYDRYLYDIDKAIRFRYSREQRKAMSGKIPMTEELFWGCMNVTYCRHDGKLQWLMKTYPQYMKKFHEEYERERRENPELLVKEEQEWQELRQRLVDDFGEDYVREHFN
jgi:hypothetical protein